MRVLFFSLNDFLNVFCEIAFKTHSFKKKISIKMLFSNFKESAIQTSGCHPRGHSPSAASCKLLVAAIVGQSATPRVSVRTDGLSSQFHSVVI